MHPVKTITHRDNGNDSVAQLVEQYTFNVWVLGSSPSGITKKPQISEAFFISEKYEKVINLTIKNPLGPILKLQNPCHL